jgi:hypothetical protein
MGLYLILSFKEKYLREHHTCFMHIILELDEFLEIVR